MIIITKKLHPRRLAAGCLLGACAVILLGAAFGVVEAVPAAPVRYTRNSTSRQSA